MGSHSLDLLTIRLRLRSLSCILLSRLWWHFGFLGINTNSELLSKSFHKVWFFFFPKDSVSLDKGPGPPEAGDGGKLIVYSWSHVTNLSLTWVLGVGSIRELSKSANLHCGNLFFCPGYLEVFLLYMPNSTLIADCHLYFLGPIVN